jgi:hypothetical protein
MDYSKREGGTRVHDAMKARTLATGIGSSQNAIKEHGSHRAAKVIAGIRPGQIVSDRGLRPHVAKRDADAQACADERMEAPPISPDQAVHQWPMSSGSKSQESCGVAQTKDGVKNTSNDQTEQTRVPTTGRHKRMHEVMNMPLRGAGK